MEKVFNILSLSLCFVAGDERDDEQEEEEEEEEEERKPGDGEEKKEKKRRENTRKREKKWKKDNDHGAQVDMILADRIYAHGFPFFFPRGGRKNSPSREYDRESIII